MGNQEIELVEIESANCIGSLSLQERALRGKAKITHHFVAMSADVELAFVALDLCPPPKPLVLYELYVDPAQRNRGIGTNTLIAVETLARSRRYQEIVLKAEPLDETSSRSRLINWYQNRGYCWRDQNREVLRKFL